MGPDKKSATLETVSEEDIAYVFLAHISKKKSSYRKLLTDHANHTKPNLQ